MGQPCISPTCWRGRECGSRGWRAGCHPARSWNLPTTKCSPTPWKDDGRSERSLSSASAPALNEIRLNESLRIGHATRYQLAPADGPADDPGSPHDPIDGNPAIADHGAAGT